MQPIRILGQVPSGKNRHQIVPNRLTGKPILLKNKKYQAWESDALWQLKSVSPIKKYPVAMTLLFWVVDNRKRDLDNMCASVCDVLQKAGIIEGDDWLHLRPITLDWAGIDKINPRVECWLDET